MVIQVTDANDVYVPRFCYHEKLADRGELPHVPRRESRRRRSRCRRARRRVAEGMKVFTKSAKAIAAQSAVMEFLLINHPLDCPICDQGGECELQDLAMGFGRDISRYTERKRVVKDKNLGPLVSTDMTRCIHCTRCVRFTQEIAGLPAARHRRPRRDDRDRHVHRDERRSRAVREHHRSVPGRRAEQQAVSLSRARVGNDAASARVAARQRRHEHLRARAAWARDAHRAASERRRERDLDRRPRSLQLPGHLQRRSLDEAARSARTACGKETEWETALQLVAEKSRPRRETAWRRTDRRDRRRRTRRSKSCICSRASRAGSAARTWIIACIARTSVTRRAIRFRRRSAARSRSSRHASIGAGRRLEPA